MESMPRGTSNERAIKGKRKKWMHVVRFIINEEEEEIKYIEKKMQER